MCYSHNRDAISVNNTKQIVPHPVYYNYTNIGINIQTDIHHAEPLLRDVPSYDTVSQWWVRLVDLVINM